MTRNTAAAERWLIDRDCEISTLDGELFVIVPSTSVPDEIEYRDGFDNVIEHVTGVRYNWGYNDEYSTCANCGVVIRTSPDSYMWTPEFWDSADGYICADCVKSNYVDDYLDDCTRHSKDSVKTCHIVNPADHGFHKVLTGLKYGLHEEMADDPRKIIKWLTKVGLESVIVTRPSQFYAEYDVYVRSASIDDDTGDVAEITYDEIVALRTVLVGEDNARDMDEFGEIPGDKYNTYRDHLLSEFRQYPSPAQATQAALKRITKSFTRIDHDGNLTEYDTFEEWAADSR